MKSSNINFQIQRQKKQKQKQNKKKTFQINAKNLLSYEAWCIIHDVLLSTFNTSLYLIIHPKNKN